MMYRFNHGSRCAECTRYHTIKETCEDDYWLGRPTWMIPTIFMCRDCWYNEDVL